MTTLYRRVHRSILHCLLVTAARVRCIPACHVCNRGFPCRDTETRYYEIVSEVAYQQLEYTYSTPQVFEPRDIYIEAQLLARHVLIAMESGTNMVRLCPIPYDDCDRCPRSVNKFVKKAIMQQLDQLRTRYRLITVQERWQNAERERLGRQNGHRSRTVPDEILNAPEE